MTKDFFLYVCPECKRAYLSDVRRRRADGSDISPACDHNKQSRAGLIGSYTVQFPTTYVGRLTTSIDE